MTVHIINPSEDYVHAELGITDERNDEIREVTAGILKEAVREKKTIGAILREISMHCKHPNELAFYAYGLGVCMEKARNPLTFLEMMKP